MDQLHEIAKTNYQSSSPELKALADSFFQSMDADGNGTVDSSEFLEFMEEEGYTEMEGLGSYFKKIDKDGNGSLDFFEVMTLYYIIKSGREPVCRACDVYVPGRFSSCLKCQQSDLCSDCCREARCCLRAGQKSARQSSASSRSRRGAAPEADGRRRRSKLETFKKALEALDLALEVANKHCTIM